MKEIKCMNCGKDCRNKFCSLACYHIYQSKNICPGQYKAGHPGLRDEKNPLWKGSRAGYTSIHEWVYVRLGKPRKCSNCGTEKAKKYEWANISKKYKRDVKDWKRLCTSCHRVEDGSGYKMWETRRKVNA